MTAIENRERKIDIAAAPATYNQLVGIEEEQVKSMEREDLVALSKKLSEFNKLYNSMIEEQNLWDKIPEKKRARFKSRLYRGPGVQQASTIAALPVSTLQ